MLKIFIIIYLFSLGCVQIQTHHREQAVEDNSSTVSATSKPSLELQLKIFENRLKGKHEIEQYSQALPFFINIQEKISFLELPDFKTRNQWLSNQQFWKRPDQAELRFRETVKAQDIALGMTEELVRRSWGEPQEVFVSGMSAFRNMRWIYIKSQSTQEGFRQQKRIVFIEGGQVTGWDIQ